MVAGSSGLAGLESVTSAYRRSVCTSCWWPVPRTDVSCMPVIAGTQLWPRIVTTSQSADSPEIVSTVA